MENEELQPTTQPEAVDNESTENTAASTEDVATLKAQMADLDAKQRKSWERAKEAEQKYYDLKKQVEDSGKSLPTVSPDDVDMAYLAAKGYSDDEIKSLKVLAKGAGVRLRESASLPEAKPIIDWKRASQATTNATPQPSARAGVLGQKTAKPFAEQSENERKASFAATAAKYRRG